MPHISKYRFLLVPVLALAAITLWPRSADAQRRVGRGSRGVVVVSVGPRYGLYNPWYQWGPYGPYGPYGGPFGPYGPYGGYGYGRWDDQTSSLRLEVKPRESEVFVDGYRAGVVNDFDGVFQRLHVTPGRHEITIFLNGYRTAHQNLYLNVGADQKLHFDLERLAAGEASEPPPLPMAPTGGITAGEPRPMPRGPQRPAPPNGPPPPNGPDPRDNPGEPVDRGEAQSSFGTLSIRAQPGDAQILIDGERWSAPAGQDRIAIELATGRHHIEVRKDGFSSYAEDVLIRRGATLTLNVSLLRGN